MGLQGLNAPANGTGINNGNQFFGPYASTYGTWAEGSNGGGSDFLYGTFPAYNRSLLNSGPSPILFLPFSTTSIYNYANYCTHTCDVQGNAKSLETERTSSSDSLSVNDTTLSYRDLQFDEGLAIKAIDSLLDSNYLDAIYYKMQKDLYAYLDAVVDSLGLDSISNSALNNFYLKKEGEPIGLFNEVSKEAMALNDSSKLSDTATFFALTENLLADNNSVNPRGRYEINERKMNNLIFGYLLSDTGFSQNQITLIQQLAFSCPYIDGEAVYTARSYYISLFNDTIIFDDESICDHSTRMLSFQNNSMGDTLSSSNPTQKNISLYPNPGKDIIYVVTSLESNEIGFLDIYSVSGVRMAEIKISGGLTRSTLSVSGMANGVYTYQLLANKKFIEDGKLVIIK